MRILKKCFPVLLVLALLAVNTTAQNIPVPNSLVMDGIPALPISLVEEVKNYTESRGASFMDWHPAKRELIISTRFGNSNQLHYVKMPGGDRKQLTFFDEPIGFASFEPNKGDYFLFYKDKGGNEFSQIYRYDVQSKKTTLLTDGGRSQNGGLRWSSKGDKIAYGSTRRNQKDRDIYILDPLNPASDKKVLENVGGGWSVVDWSADDSKLLIQEFISVNESRLYLFDINSGTKTPLLPAKVERSTYFGVSFANNDKGIYLTTNKGREFNTLAYFELSTKKLSPISSEISWDVVSTDLSKDKSKLAFVSNENGLSKVYLLSTATNEYEPLSNLPQGIIGGVKWSADSRSIGFSYVGYNSSSDVFEYDIAKKQLIRWTESELGGMDLSTVPAPQLISWKTFDGKTISGYLYKASSKFSGKRPVLINIHGGPEGQSRPVFIGQQNYLLNELGVSIIYPNVRGSTGYGKTFTDLDNGIKRVESLRDIGALLDWIAQQPDLDKDRIMVAGGSYGGYMTLAVSYLYSDKIRCSMDIVGISNYNTFLKNTEAYRRDERRAEYGNEQDPKMAAFFEEIAPLNHTDMIRKPLFIVQGENDPRVPATEAIQMRDKIKEKGGTVWFLMAKDEGHGFRKKNNTDFHFYSTIEFIKRYLIN